jgi:hypothetical protein
MFFINPEELNTGHTTMKEAMYWIEAISAMQKPLKDIGVTTSINPWTTVMHADRGRVLKPGQDFRLIVDMDGRSSSVTACFLSHEWRDYIAKLYALYASIKPAMIWVEDDFRFHNHAPLRWGGCFCELHMKAFSDIAGNVLTREEFINGVTAPGSPHQYRKIWLDHCRDTLLDTAAILEKAVHSVSPETSIGLMSSAPMQHCAEGRDWQTLLNTFDNGCEAANRIHLPAYRERSPQEYGWNFQAISRHVSALTPEHIQILPEVENFPYSYFTKSETFTGFMVESSLLLGSSGITLNLFDFTGNGVMPQHDYSRILSTIKPRLNAMRAAGSGRPTAQLGVKALFCPNSSYTLHSAQYGEPEELCPSGEYFWTPYLNAMGIACVPDAGSCKGNGGVFAVGGQYFRNIPHNDIRCLLEYNVCLLEGEAVITLCDMGLGDLLDIQSIEIYSDESGFACYEQCRQEICGLTHARIRSQSDVGDFIDIKYSQQPETVTEVYTHTGKKVATGMCVVRGKTLILPYIPAKRLSGLLLPQRRQIIRDFLFTAAPVHLTAVLDKAHVHCVWNDCGYNACTLLLMNSGFDGHDMFCIAAPWLAERKNITLKGIHDGASLKSFNGGVMEVIAALPAMSVRMLQITWND